MTNPGHIEMLRLTGMTALEILELEVKVMLDTLPDCNADTCKNDLHQCADCGSHLDEDVRCNNCD